MISLIEIPGLSEPTVRVDSLIPLMKLGTQFLTKPFPVIIRLLTQLVRYDLMKTEIFPSRVEIPPTHIQTMISVLRQDRRNAETLIPGLHGIPDNTTRVIPDSGKHDSPGPRRRRYLGMRVRKIRVGNPVEIWCLDYASG